MRKSVKKVLIGGGLAAGTLIAAGAWSYVITRKLVEIALDRKEDETVVESKKHIAGDPETSAFVKVREDAAEKLEGSSHDTVEITAQDGINWLATGGSAKNRNVS